MALVPLDWSDWWFLYVALIPMKGETQQILAKTSGYVVETFRR